MIVLGSPSAPYSLNDYVSWEFSQGFGPSTHQVYLDGSQFTANKTSNNNPDGASGHFAYLVPSPSGGGTIYWVHSQYTGPQNAIPVSSLDLSPMGLQQLELAVKAMRREIGHSVLLQSRPEDWKTWFLVAVAIGFVILSFLSGGATAWLGMFFLFLAGAALAGAAVLVLSEGLFGTTPLPDCPSGGGTTCACYQSTLGGCYTVCVDKNGNQKTDRCGGGFPGAGLDLTSIAWGVGALVVVGVGGYVAYKIIQGHYAKKGQMQYRQVPPPYTPSTPPPYAPPATPTH